MLPADPSQPCPVPAHPRPAFALERPVHLAAMAHTDHLDDDGFVVDRVDDAIVALSSAIEFPPAQLLAAARVIAQRLHALEQALDVLFGNPAQVSRHRRLDP